LRWFTPVPFAFLDKKWDPLSNLGRMEARKHNKRHIGLQAVEKTILKASDF
jgi:hypothetical protein